MCGCMMSSSFHVCLLLFALLFCCSGWAVYAAGKKVEEGNPLESVKLFKDGSSGGRGGITDYSHVPSLAHVNGILMAFAETPCASSEGKPESSVYVKCIQKKGSEWETIKNSSNWKTESPGENTCGDAQYAFTNPTTVVKESKIYILATPSGRKQTRGGAGGPKTAASGWDLELIVGDVQNGAGDNSEKTIKWQAPVSLRDTLTAELKDTTLNTIIVRGGSGILTSKGSVVFPAMVRTEEFISYPAVIHSPGGEKDSWKISKGMSITTQDCVDPSITELETEKLLMMVSCKDGRRKVFESSDMGDTWTEASATLSRVWINPGRMYHTYAGLIAATLESTKKVMLLTVPVYSGDQITTGKTYGTILKGRLHLWMSDAENRHIYDVGPVSAEGGDAASSLLYTPDNEMFCLYELYSTSGGSGAFDSLQLARLTSKLDEVKSMLRNWEEVDTRVSSSCISTATKNDACTTPPMPTTGLVGFLSGNVTKNEWKDEYLCVDATVRGDAVTKTNGSGLTFQGSGSWAEWPVSKQGQIQRYHFANYNFTLMATVTIHSQPTAAEGSIPLMGVKLSDGTDEKTLMGLSYTADRKWNITFNGGWMQADVREKRWALDKEYHVTLILRDGNKGSVYIDGERVDNEGAGLRTDTESISHFYIGGDGQGGTGTTADSSKDRVSVKNVLLYNRPLTGEEVSTLNGKETPVSQPMASEPGANQRKTDKTAVLSDTPGGANNTQSTDEQGSQQPSVDTLTGTNINTSLSFNRNITSGDVSACVHVSGVLLLLLSLGLWETVV